MNAEPALPLDYAAQPNPPARPSPYDDSIRATAALAIAKDVADWLEEQVSDELIEMLTETMPHSAHIDGFKWALKLHERYSFDGDARLVEILDSTVLWSAHRGAVIAWVEANKITPTFAVGDRVLVEKHGPGTITGITPDTAQYIIRTEDRIWTEGQSGFLIAFEHCSEVANG